MKNLNFPVTHARTMSTVLLLALFAICVRPTFAQKKRAPQLDNPKPNQSSPKTVHVDQQTGLSILCKNVALPEGLSISGEIFAESCNGVAWIVKPASSATGPQTRPAFEQPNFYLPIDGGTNYAEVSEVIQPGQCDAFDKEVKTLYDFNAATLTENQKRSESLKLDAFWQEVDASRAKLVPCLRRALRKDTSGSFFAIDGSRLLVEVDPTPASKALQVKKFIDANLDGVDLEIWVHTIALRGVEGFDTSEAGAKWLSYPKAHYTLSMHGDYPIGSFLGAVFIFGSMRDELAAPVLLRIANDVRHPHRDDAIAILTSLATREAYEGLRTVNTAGLSAANATALRNWIEHPDLLQPRTNPKLTREENLRAFQGIINGDYSAFRELVWKAPDGEVDAVATLRAEDIPLLRQTRRVSISRCNQHAVSDYASFSSILWALVWKYELKKEQGVVATN